jgi:macrolide-specific efflux system membrane fusion protein
VGTADTVVVLSDRLIVNAQVDETDIGRVKTGLKAMITLDAYPSEPVSAKVGQIRYEAKTVNNVTMYEVYVRPKKIPSFMRSGMTANVEFLLDGKTDALLLPTEAVRSADGKSLVLLPDEKGARPKRSEVVTGLTDGKNIEILEGLKEGDKVLIAVFSAASAGKAQANPFMPGRMGGRSSSGGSTQRSSGAREGPSPP